MKRILKFLCGVFLLGINPLGALAAFGGSLFVPQHKMEGVQVAGIYTEQWQARIIELLYKNNDFLMACEDDSEYVNNLTVHLPQAGVNPNVVKNRSTGGNMTNTVKRTDTTIDYSIDEYTTDPSLIPNIDKVQLSYSKMDSVINGMIRQTRQVVADNILIEWAPTGASGNILLTSGISHSDPSATRVSYNAHTPSATGTRLGFTQWDVAQAELFLNNQDVPMEDRYCVLDATMYNQLRNDMTATQFRDFSSVVDPKTGVVGQLFGFTFFRRSTGLVYDNTPAVKAYGAAGAATDNGAALFWQKNQLRRAIGDVHIFETLNSAVLYGDAYSVLLRMGGAKTRANEIGIVAVVQASGN